MMKLILAFALVSGLVQAKKSVETKPQPFQLSARTTYGSKVVTIRTVKEGKKITMELTANDGQSAKKTITEKDWKFLLEEFENLPTAETLPPECYRARMEVQLAERDAKGEIVPRNKSSCFAIKTITEPKFVRFAKTLTAAF